jgi:hypothetical protein
MSKTRTLVLAGIAAAAMALATLGSASPASAAPLNPGVWAVADTDTSASDSDLSATPKLPRCKPPDCYYA